MSSFSINAIPACSAPSCLSQGQMQRSQAFSNTLDGGPPLMGLLMAPKPYSKPIAGEDDLDAPDLCDWPRAQTPSDDERSLKRRDGQPRLPPRMPGNGRARDGRKGEIPVTFNPEQSAALREKLLTELGAITSADLAAAWTREALTAK